MENQVGTHLEASSRLFSFHSDGRWYVGSWKGKVIHFTKLQTSRAIITTDLERHAHWSNSDMNIMEATDRILIGFKVHATR